MYVCMKIDKETIGIKNKFQIGKNNKKIEKNNFPN